MVLPLNTTKFNRPSLLTAKLMVQRSPIWQHLARTPEDEIFAEWEDREQLEHWVWILSGESPSTRLERFLSHEIFRPTFILFILIRTDQNFQSHSDFTSLLEYVSRTYCQLLPQRPELRSVDHNLNMSPLLFLKMLRRLVHHSLRLAPETLPTLAEIVTSYLSLDRSSLWPSGSGGQYASQCRIFNQAMLMFTHVSFYKPLQNIEYNWKAQKHLLEFSTKLKRPFILNRGSYRAIQSVMIGREKSDEEVKVAVRSAKSWPPYRRAWDGMDEHRRLVDDLSRGVKTGILARAAGYPETIYDRTLNTLGGAVLDRSPTVQTRAKATAIIERLKKSDARNEPLELWAAQVRATRNAQEAWARFRSPPAPHLIPSAHVYAEMFEKLVAHEVTDPSNIVPGDVREVFPVYQPANLSEYEKLRIQPPTVQELYEDMLQRGRVKPIAAVLRVLVANSTSEEEVLRYFEDSNYRQFTTALKAFVADQGAVPSAEDLITLPLSIFNTYISFLCNMQRTADLQSKGIWNPSYILRALAIIPIRLRRGMLHGDSYKPPWHQVLRTLFVSAPRSVLQHQLVRSKRLEMFLKIFDWTRDLTGRDSRLLELMCSASSRMMISTLLVEEKFVTKPLGVYDTWYQAWWSRRQDAKIRPATMELLQTTHAKVLELLEWIKAPAFGTNGVHVYICMKALGMYRDWDGMTTLMRWSLRQLERQKSLGNATTLGTHSNLNLLNAFYMFDAIAGPHLKEEIAHSIAARRQQMVDDGYPLEMPDPGEPVKEEAALVDLVGTAWESARREEEHRVKEARVEDNFERAIAANIR